MINLFFGVLTILCLLGVAYGVSDNRKAIKWRTVIIGLIGQFLIIVFAIKVPIGQAILEKLAFGFQSVIDFGMEGVTFVFGDLSTNMYVFAVGVLSLLVFTSALVSVLYFLKVIPFIINTVGAGLAKLLKCSKVECMCAVANSFLGGNESSLVIKPYLPKLTKSEFFCCAAGGFSSASAGILAGYVAMGIDMKYLLLAVFTVPFACLMFSKMLVPETEVSEFETVEVAASEDKNIFEAIASGAATGGQMAIAIGCSLIAFVGMIALLNGILGIFGLSVSEILGWIFTPIGMLLGIPGGEITTFAQLMGTKTAVNEFVAYSQFTPLMPTLNTRTVAMLSVGICSFANLSVIAIQTMGIGALCPERKTEMAKIGLKTLFCGILANLSTMAIVGMFVS